MRLPPDICQMKMQMLIDLIDKIGHNAVREIFKANRELRAIRDDDTFPVSLMYRISLARKIDDPREIGGYCGMTVQEIAEAEGVAKRYIYRLMHQKMEKKFVVSELADVV